MILALLENLFFISKIEPVAASVGYDVRWVGRSEHIIDDEEMSLLLLRSEQFGMEDLAIIGAVSRLQPELIIMDLTNENIPWGQWIHWIKSSPATMRCPLVCFGPHTDNRSRKRALSYGADGVFSNSTFFRDLPKIIRKYARSVDRDELAAICTHPLSEKAVIGMEQFNRGEYFEAHESLEEAWNEETAPGRDIYRAILQIAVAYLQITRHNYRGAIKMFLRAQQWIQPLQSECRGVNIQQLRLDAASAYNALLSISADELWKLDQINLAPVIYKMIE